MQFVDFVKLSKTMAHALRHEPQSYHLELDDEGWVLISDLLKSLKDIGFNVTNEDIFNLIELSDKKRYQIKNEKIRASYGHSLNNKIVRNQKCPPKVLFHGTLSNNLDSILKDGLLPMKRQYVHLSINANEAKNVAKRRKGDIIILKISASFAYKNSVKFYKEKNGIWLSEAIPSQYINII